MLGGGWEYGHPPSGEFVLNGDSPQARGLLAWYPLGPGQYGVAQDVLNRRPLTIYNGGPTRAGGTRGLVAEFAKASSQYVAHLGNGFLDYPFTLTCWFRYLTTPNSFGRDVLVAVSDRDDGYDRDQINIYNPGTVQLEAFTTTNFDATAAARIDTPALVLGTWYHAVATFAATNSRAIHLNATYNATNTTSLTPTTRDTIAIGACVRSSGPTAYVGAQISDVRIYDHALAVREVEAIYRHPWELYEPVVRWWFGVGTAASGTQYEYSIGGTLACAAGLVRSTGKRTTGAVGASGVAVRLIGRSLSGAVGSGAVLARQVGRAFTGAVDVVGTTVKQAQRALVGAVTSTGVVGGQKSFTRVLSGAVALAGVVTKQARKVLSGAVSSEAGAVRKIARGLTGALSASGRTIKRTARTLSGAVTSTSSIQAQNVFLMILAGVVGAGGAVTRRIGKALGGTVEADGTLGRVGAFVRTIGGTVAASGAVVKRTARSLAGQVTSTATTAGSLGAQTFTQALSGAVAIAGTLTRRIGKGVSGTVGVGSVLAHDATLIARWLYAAVSDARAAVATAAERLLGRGAVGDESVTDAETSDNG